MVTAHFAQSIVVVWRHAIKPYPDVLQSGHGWVLFRPVVPLNVVMQCVKETGSSVWSPEGVVDLEKRILLTADGDGAGSISFT